MKAILVEGKNIAVDTMGKHVASSQAHQRNCDAQLVMIVERCDFVDSAKRRLLRIAKALVMKKNVDDARHLFARFLQPSTTFWLCATCETYVKMRRNHRNRKHCTDMVDRDP
jgi:hypothetical protein